MIGIHGGQLITSIKQGLLGSLTYTSQLQHWIGAVKLGTTYQRIFSKTGTLWFVAEF